MFFAKAKKGNLKNLEEEKKVYNNIEKVNLNFAPQWKEYLTKSS